LTKDKKHIVLVCNDGDYFLRHRLFVVNRLTESGVEVTVLVGGKPIPADHIDGWKYIFVPIERFGLSLVNDLRLVIRTAQTIWTRKPDAVHLITLKPAVFSGLVAVASRLLLGYPKRILVTLPGLGRALSPASPDRHTYRFAKPLILLALRLLSKSRTVHFSFETKSDYDFMLAQGVVNGRNGTVVDGAGVDSSLFYPTNKPRRDQKTRVLFASRLLKAKGLYAFLSTARSMAHHQQVEFVVAGLSESGDPSGVPADYLNELEEIHYLGRVNDMPDLLRYSDIVCLPTKYGEGIPRILIEAAASGLAMIASDQPGCLEIVRDGVTGQIIFGDNDKELSHQLATAIAIYLDSPELLAAHKQAAYQHFLSRGFSETAVAARFCELLDVSLPSSNTEGMDSSSPPYA
jgi:glycosyltransferase involved in cell wall biosynthesis